MRSIYRLASLCIFGGIAWTSQAFAQDPVRVTCADFFLDVNNPDTAACRGNLAAIPFDLLAPGARALGLGGAFAAVADDATAAEANPAGQTILTRPEVSVHVRNASYNARFLDPNQLDGELYGAQGPGPITAYKESNTKVSFASFVYPMDRFVLSGYYQNSGALTGSSNIAALNTEYDDLYVASTAIDVEQDSYGLAGAYRLSDMFSIGASLKYSSLDYHSLSRSSVFGFRDLDVHFPDAGPYIDEISLSSASQTSDHDLTWNLGLLINPNGKFSGGLVYKQGGSYDAVNTLSVLNVTSCAGDDTCAQLLGGSVQRAQKIELPDIISAGIALRPSDTWLFSLQVDRIDYSRLPEGSPTGFLFGTFQGNSVAIDPLGKKYSVHLGAEKTFLFEKPILGMNLLSIRAGGFSDPDHDSYADLDSGDTHYTFGLGTVIAEHLQLDLGGEWSDRVNAVVMSAVYHF